MKMRLFLVLSLLASWAAAQELPITKVVLFTSGVGYFEHRGAVSGDAVVPLTFTEDQVNDVLKSLILRDTGGTVGVVGYPSQDPLDRSLKSFALDLGGPGGLEVLLPQLRGVALTLNTPAEITGRLVGLDKRATTEKTETWLTLATDAGLKVVPLGSVSGLKILDAKVEKELSLALSLVAGSRDTRKKTVSANFKGTGTRQVSVGYIAEAPVWKTSYRLDLSGTKPFLQAWAIVENTGEVDWTQVRLSLVSGRPVSFIQDLYTPLYVQRPFYEPEREAGPAPRVSEAGYGAPSPAPAMAPSAKAMSRSAEIDDLAYAEEVEASPRLRNSGVVAAATGGAAGELFQFTLQAPVTLARHQSALIPLAASDIDAKKVSVYNPSVDAVHPQNAVWITNSTGLRLPAGPVTVYDGGTYAGDALTDSLVEKDKRLWTYATDLSVRGETRESGDQTTTKITLVRGVLNYRRDLTWTTTYSFVNAGAEARSLLVEHPYRGERTLVSPKETEKTPSLLRFSVEAAAGGKAELVVKEMRTVVETQGITNWRSEDILAVAQSGPLSAAVKAGLQKAAELKAAADAAARVTADLERRKAEQEAGQGRIRDNLSAVGRDSAQGQTYLKRLLDSEALIDQLTQDLAAARKAQAAAQKTLEDAIRTLSAE